MARDYYETLGVDRGADDATIKKAFRRLARELHPDVNAHDPDAEEKFKEAAAAYEVLSDPERRRLYDSYGEDGLRGRGYAPDMDAFGSVSDLFSAFFGAGGFDAAFGAGRRGAPGAGSRAATSSWPPRSTSPTPRAGRRWRSPTRRRRCARAATATGRSRARRSSTARAATARASTSGWRGRRSASSCGPRSATSARARAGSRRRRAASARAPGMVGEQRRVAVDIPPGIADGQRIRLTRRGHAGQRGGPPGDLYVVVRVREDERFLRDGEDLVTVIDVAAPLAALGTTVQVPTFDGDVPLEIPAGTQPGETIVLRGRGLPPLSRGRTGDLRVVVNVAIPRRLSREQRSMLEDFAATITEDNLRSDEGMLAKLKRVLAG